MVGEQDYKLGESGFLFPCDCLCPHKGRNYFPVLTHEIAITIHTFHFLTILGENPFGYTLASPTRVENAQPLPLGNPISRPVP